MDTRAVPMPTASPAFRRAPPAQSTPTGPSTPSTCASGANRRRTVGKPTATLRELVRRAVRGSLLTTAHAQGGTRTRKTRRSGDFESPASTNSTTWARATKSSRGQAASQRWRSLLRRYGSGSAAPPRPARPPALSAWSSNIFLATRSFNAKYFARCSGERNVESSFCSAPSRSARLR